MSDRYKRIAYAFRKRIGFLRRMNEAFWAGEFACPGCGRDTNNGHCRACMHGQIPDTPSHAKAREEGRLLGLEQAAQVVSHYLLHNSQRAVSWHEVADALEQIRALKDRKP